MHQLRDQLPVAGPLGMAQGVDRIPLLEPPAGRDSLQVPVRLRPLPSEIGDQVGAEQRVDAVNARGGAFHECRLLTELVELPGGVGPVRQLGREISR